MGHVLWTTYCLEVVLKGKKKVWESLFIHNKIYVLTLPERQEDDRLHSTEFPHWFIRAQEFSGGKVEQEQGIQGQTHRDVVDNGDVQVSTVRTVMDMER